MSAQKIIVLVFNPKSYGLHFAAPYARLENCLPHCRIPKCRNWHFSRPISPRSFLQRYRGSKTIQRRSERAYKRSKISDASALVPSPGYPGGVWHVPLVVAVVRPHVARAHGVLSRDDSDDPDSVQHCWIARGPVWG